MTSRAKNSSPRWDRACELRSAMAVKIAAYMGSAENRATDISGLTLRRRTAPCLAMPLKLEMPVVEIPECMLPACGPAGRRRVTFPFLSCLIQRDIIYRSNQGRRAHACERLRRWGPGPPYNKGDPVDQLSTLHYHFRALTAMSPLHYRKQLRLQARGDEMLIANTVDSARYSHPSLARRPAA